MSRILYLDNLCGILIIYMIFFFHLSGHCGVGESIIMIVLRNIFDFFMGKRPISRLDGDLI